MTYGDIGFLKEIGISPCSLGDPLPGPPCRKRPPKHQSPSWRRKIHACTSRDMNADTPISES
jgi:hypothetical protein